MIVVVAGVLSACPSFTISWTTYSPGALGKKLDRAVLHGIASVVAPPAGCERIDQRYVGPVVVRVSDAAPERLAVDPSTTD